MRSYNYNVYDKPIKATSESAEWIFLATNLGLEMLSAACDQASSPRRPHYALFGMLLAIAAVLISIGELIYRGKNEKVVLGKWGMLWWFYHPPPPRHTPFGTLPDIFGLVAGISQCICSIVQYVYCLQHADNPFKASLLPAIFLMCLGGSKLSNNRMNGKTTANKDSREYSSSMKETSMHPSPKYYAPTNIPSLDDHEVEGNIEWLQRQKQEQRPRWLRQWLLLWQEREQKQEWEQEWWQCLQQYKEQEQEQEREQEQEQLRQRERWQKQKRLRQWQKQKQKRLRQWQKRLRVLKAD